MVVLPLLSLLMGDDHLLSSVENTGRKLFNENHPHMPYEGVYLKTQTIDRRGCYNYGAPLSGEHTSTPRCESIYSALLRVSNYNEVALCN